MDIIHRLNPFHRPSSSLRSSQTPTPTLTYNSNARPSSSLESNSNHLSIDSTLPPHSTSSYDHDENRYSISPNPPTSPIRGHNRTPSILRSLAHHPSLSALKSKSKKKSRKLKDELIPPVPIGDYNEYVLYTEGGQGNGKGRKGSLKLSKSLPRDLRLSNEYRDETPPPLPSHPLIPTSSHNLTYPRSASKSSKSTPPNKPIISIRRKPAPTPPSPENDPMLYNQSIDYDHFPTPESMRLKMKFEIDLPTRSSSYEQSPPHSQGNRSGLGLGSPTRRRYLSFDERLSPPRNRIRPMSSPADSPPRSRQNQTTKHPHPVPIAQSHLYAQSLYADSTTFFSTDFGAAPSHALEWHEEEADDGLDLFIASETLPPGTPGGKKEDLQRGALVDGAKHEKDAVRFFSRDTYPPASPSPDSTPSKKTPTKSILKTSPSKSPRHRRAESSPACSPIRNPNNDKDAFSRAAKRSSSPFEVKLSANVTKRMSLDAFGTSTLPTFNDEQAGFEEVLVVDSGEQEEGFDEFPNSIAEEEEEEEEADHYQLQDNGLDGYEAHELSKITEVPYYEDHSTSMESFDLNHTPANRPSISDSHTRFYTPLSPTLNAQGLPIFNSYSPSPLIQRKHMSAPPLAKTTSLLEAHADHSKALKDQLRAGEFMMDVLKSEIDELRTMVQDQGHKEQAYEAETEARITEIEELKEKCEAKDIALNQLRQAMKENEEFFENLQEAQHDLAERCAKLEEDNLNLNVERENSIKDINKLKEADERMRLELGKFKNSNSLLKNDKKELESVVFELRRELKWTENEIRTKDTQIQDKDNFNLDQKQKLQALQEELEKTQKILLKENEKIESLQKEVQEASSHSDQALSSSSVKLELAQGDIADKEKTINQLQQELATCREGLQAERAATKEVEMDLHEQEFTLSSLREQLDSSNQTIESINLFLTEKDNEIETLVSALLDSQAEIKTLKSQAVENEATISSLKEKVELARFEKNERRFQAEVEINQLHEQLEELTRSSAEREWAGRQGTEMIARLMEEKRVWEEEKDELIEMINRNSIDEESASNLRDQITNLENQLNSLKHHTETLQIELEDSQSSIQHKATMIHAQEAELSALRLTINQFEESSSTSKESFDKQAKDSERVENRLRERIEELEIQLESRETALKESIIRNESSKQSSTDVNSRLLAYLSEIDQLKLKETKFDTQLEELRKQSLDDTLKVTALEKELSSVKEDKELLNIALESKTLELTLLQRNSANPKRATPCTPSSTSTLRASHGYTPSTSTLSTSRSSRNSFTVGSSINSMSKSTSKIPNTPTPSTGFDNTPLPRRLTTSTSATVNSRLRRETISSTPSSTSNTRTPLGVSTIHNKPVVAEKSKPELKSGIVGGNVQTIERRTSLPVLVRRPSSVISTNGRRESLTRVDEV